MTKHSSRLILTISCFTINASELVLRKKIRFVTRIYVECITIVCRITIDLTIALLVIVLSKKHFFGNSSGYCNVIFLSVALLVTVLGFLFQLSLPLRLVLKILLKNIYFLL